MKNTYRSSRLQRVRAKRNEPLTLAGVSLKKKVWRDILYIVFFIILVSGFGYKIAHAEEPLVSPVPNAHAEMKAVNDLIDPFKIFIQVKPTRTPKELEPSITVTPTKEPIKRTECTWENFVKAVHKVAPIYSYPKRLILAQGALESARGTNTYAVERCNFLSINAVDWNPDLAYDYENPEQCVVDYIMIVRRNFPQTWNARGDATLMLYYLKVNDDGMMYATDPDYIQKVESMPEFKYTEL